MPQSPFKSAFRRKDFAPARGLIVFATEKDAPLLDAPRPEHIEAWNRRVGLPPAAIAAYLEETLSKTSGLDFPVRPRLIFAVGKSSRLRPGFILELWPRDVALPQRFNREKRCERVARATRELHAAHVYGMWFNVTRDFNRAGKTESLQQKGIGRAMQAVLMPLFMAMGYARFTLDAQSTNTNRGAAVWPRFGAEVCAESKGIKTGLDRLPGALTDKFAAHAANIPAAIRRRVEAVLKKPDSKLLMKLSAIRHEMDDPYSPGRRAEIADILLRNEYIRCYFALDNPRWQDHFFRYVGKDTRPQLQARLQDFKPA